MGKKTKREGARPGARRLRKCFSVFTRCSERVFLYLYGVHSDERHGVTLPYSLQQLRRHLFIYFSWEHFRSFFNAF